MHTLTLVNAAGSLAIVALGLWVGTRRPLRGPTVAFAAFTGGWGAFHLAMGLFLVGHSSSTFGTLLLTATSLVGAAGLFWMALVLPRPLPAAGRGRLLALPCVAGGAVLVTSIIGVPRSQAFWYSIGEPGLAGAAPIGQPATGLLFASIVFALVLFPLRFLREDARPSDPGQLALLGAGLVINAGYFAGDGVLWPGFELLPGAMLLGMILAALLWLRAASRKPDHSAAARNVALLTLAMPLAGMLSPFAAGNDGPAPGITRFVTVLILAYAILRHRLFGLDVKVKWTLKQSTVAAVFLAVVFLVSEGAQLAFGDGQEWLGLLAGGVLVFALTPLQRFAERVSDAAMPGVKPVDEMTDDERATVYREAATEAWANGNLDRSERALLDRLQTSLSLPRDQAMYIEQEAARREGAG